MINRGLKVLGSSLARKQSLQTTNMCRNLCMPLSQHVYGNIRMFCNKDSSSLDQEGSDKDFGAVNKVDTQNLEDKDVLKEIDGIIQNNKVVLFMKGSPQQPMCGYSRFVSQVLRFYKIDDYKHVDIQRDENIRRLVKVYSEWPTIPQQYVNQEFIGGADIVTEMHKDGTMKSLLEGLN